MNLPPISDTTMTLLSILAIIIITSIVTRIVASLMNRMNRFRKDMTAIYLIRDIINYVIYFIALMTILQLFGINLAGTLLSLGIVGIAVSFAAKDIISNLFSGIILILGRSIKVGDTVSISGEKGYVERISLRSTTIVNDYGVRNHVPNSILTNNEYLQYKPPEKYRVDIITGLDLDIDIEEFRNYMIERMESYPEISENPKPEIYGREISFKQSKVNKDKYKIIIMNEIRKFVQKGENNE